VTETAIAAVVTEIVIVEVIVTVEMAVVVVGETVITGRVDETTFSEMDFDRSQQIVRRLRRIMMMKRLRERLQQPLM
jgi:hypothetical protein